MGARQELLPELKLQSLEHQRNISGLCQVHRMVSSIAPRSVCDLLPAFLKPERSSRSVVKNHHYQLKVTRSKNDHHMRSFVPKFAHLWNCLPSQCIYGKSGDLQSLQSFKVTINRYLLEAQSAAAV